MYKSLLILSLFILCVAHGVRGEQSPDYVKRGWSFAPMPAISYGSDLGTQLGVMADVYYFGDGSTYPEYMHKFSAEVCYFTKGSGIYHIFYDSKYLIPKLRLTASASYIPNTMMGFFGFNGYAAPYLRDTGDAFYAIDRNLLRVTGDIQGSLGGGLGWAAGVSFFNYDTGRVGLEKYAGTTTLYDLYVRNGIIHPDEAGGGSHVEFRVGAVHDTRDNEPDPTRGIYTDVILYGSPDVINRRGNDYLKLAASWCHYIPLIPGRLTLAYRLSYQGTLAGNVPFYIQQNYATLYLRQINSDILGGAISLRGVKYNRVVGDGMAWANVELRCRLFDFKLFGQEWYLSTNPFFDAGAAVSPFRLAQMRDAHTDRDLIYSPERESLHTSAGLGLKAVMNRNFVLSAEYGVPFDERDGDGGVYLNLNYIF